MALNRNALPSIHGNRFGVTLNGHQVQDGRIMQPSWKDRGGQAILLDHFTDAILSTSRWGVFHGSDGGSASPVINVQKGGVVRGVCGAAAGATMALNGSQLNGSLNWEADKTGLEFGGAAKLDVITTSCFFIGFSDQTAALEMPATVSAGSLTTNASDLCGFLFDTAATAATWKCVSCAADVDGTLIDTGIAPVAATFDLFAIEIDAAGNATFYLNGVTVGSQAIAVTPGTPLTPYVAGFRRAAATLNWDCDFISCRQDR